MPGVQKGIDERYSKWNDINISDDEDDTHPNVDTECLFQYRHDYRLAEKSKKEKQKESRTNHVNTLQKKKNELKEKLDSGSCDANELDKLKENIESLEEQETHFLDLERQLEEQEAKFPKWDIDNICHDTFNSTQISKEPATTAEKHLTDGLDSLDDEEKDAEIQKRLDDYCAEMSKNVLAFSELTEYRDSYNFLGKHPDVLCNESCEYMCLLCVDAMVSHQFSRLKEGKEAIPSEIDRDEPARRILKQCLMIQYINALTKAGMNGVQLFFERVHSPSPTYMDSFEKELDDTQLHFSMKAKERVDKSIEAYKESKIAELESKHRRENKILIFLLSLCVALLAGVFAYVWHEG